jgi:hypothetical protein
MEETLGERINLNRTTEALETGADQIATGCPFCRVMLSDGLTAKQADGSAREEVEVLDVAQLLLASVKRAPARKPAAVEGTSTEAAAAGAATATAVLDKPATDETEPEPAEAPEATKAEPEPADVTQTEDTVTAPAEVGAAADASAEAEPDAGPEPATEPEAEPEAKQASPADEKRDDTLF